MFRRKIALGVLLLMTAAAGLTTEDAAAFKPGTTPVSFGGSAFLITYNSGVAEVLLNKGVIIPGATQMSGLSGGSFAAVGSALGIKGVTQMEFWKEIIAECVRLEAACIGRLNALAEAALFNLDIPSNISDMVNGVLRIGLAQLNGNSKYLYDSATWVVDEWTSNEDLLSCLTSTDHLPCFTGSTTFTVFRNQPVFDGGYANGFADLCPYGPEDCLKVSSLYVGDMADHTCDPEICPLAASTNCTASHRTHQVSELYENGPLVDQWPLDQVKQFCPEDIFGDLPPFPLPYLVPNSGWNHTTIPDIYPGRYNKLPMLDGRQVLACEWKSWASRLPAGREMEAVDLIYQQGKDDALAWYYENLG